MYLQFFIYFQDLPYDILVRCSLQAFLRNFFTLKKNLVSDNQCFSMYLSTASWICLIQWLRSSLELVWISYISGPVEDALIKNIPLSSLATSLTISFWRAITAGFWSYAKEIANNSVFWVKASEWPSKLNHFSKTLNQLFLEDYFIVLFYFICKQKKIMWERANLFFHYNSIQNIYKSLSLMSGEIQPDQDVSIQLEMY